MSIKKKLKKRLWIVGGVLSSLLITLLILIFFTNIPIWQRIKFYAYKIEFQFINDDNVNKSIRADFEIYGIDISKYNGTINWDKLASEGQINKKPISFVYIKATEGKNLRDRKYKSNWLNAKKKGMLRGAYHFYRPEINSEQQFKNFKETVKLELGDLPPVLDIEVRGKLSFKRYTQGILNLLKLMENQYGIKPIIYAPVSLYGSLVQNAELKKYPLWLATYSMNIPKKHEKSIIFVQYSQEGRVAGISHPVDLNGLKGDKLKLQQHIIK